MNNESPLIPQGSLQEQKNKGRSRVRIAIFFGLILHGIGLMAFLLLGCNHSESPDKSTTSGGPSVPLATEPSTTNPTPSFETTNPPTPEASNPAPVVAAPTPPAVSNPTPPIVEPPTSPTPGPTAANDYKVLKGDTLGKIAKKSHVSLKALSDANPGVDSTKLKIGQVIHIPAAGAAGAAPTPGSSGASAAPVVAEQSYTVKSGDSLTKIAGQFGVKVKALRTANALRTDKIKVGQKLKIPEKTAAAAAAAPAPTDLVPTPSSSPAGSSSTGAPPATSGR